jgi:hypothetical protein
MSELGDSGGGLSAQADPPVRPVIAATAHRMYSQRPRNRYSSSSAKCKLTLQTYEAEQFRSLSRRRHWQIVRRQNHTVPLGKQPPGVINRCEDDIVRPVIRPGDARPQMRAVKMEVDTRLKTRHQRDLIKLSPSVKSYYSGRKAQIYKKGPNSVRPGTAAHTARSAA